MRVLSLFALAAALAACPGPATNMARAQEAVQEFNSATRYGQSEIAMNDVSASSRESFEAHHRGWGTQIRIADVEVAGVRRDGDHDAEAVVRVAWYRPDQQELRSTTLKQGWREEGNWHLFSEERIDGDIGLLNEPVVYEAPARAAEPARFPTVRLGGGQP
jgi:hypothetical protein